MEIRRLAQSVIGLNALLMLAVFAAVPVVGADSSPAGQTLSITPAAARGLAAGAAALLPAAKEPLPPPPSLPTATARALAGDARQSIDTLLLRAEDAAFHTPGEWTKAIADLNRSIELDPSGVERYADAAWLLWSSGNKAQAIDFYNRMIVANPKDPEAYFVYGFYYFQQKDYAQAVKWLETAEALGIKSPERHTYGHALTLSGRHDEALAFWRKVLADDPKDEVARRAIDELTSAASAPTATPAATPAANAK